MKAFYQKHTELLLYLFFGGLTFLVSIFSYAWFNLHVSLNELTANIISWILAVLFAFITNKIWVFDAPTAGIGPFFNQMLRFFSGRIFTLLVEELLLFIFITKLQFNSLIVKAIAQMIVITLNYVISKLLVFQKKPQS